jgi:YesN/AraC family two-component response regulator
MKINQIVEKAQKELTNNLITRIKDKKDFVGQSMILEVFADLHDSISSFKSKVRKDQIQIVASVIEKAANRDLSEMELKRINRVLEKRN